MEKIKTITPTATDAADKSVVLSRSSEDAQSEHDDDDDDDVGMVPQVAVSAYAGDCSSDVSTQQE